MRIVVVLAALVSALAAFASPAVGAGGQRSWWDVGSGSPVENDFALGLMYSPVCVGLDRVEAGRDSRAVYEMWRAAAEGAGAVLPGGAPCSYGAGVRFEGVHWLGPAVALRVVVEGAWSWEVEEFPAPERVWRFRRYGVDLGVRFGRALGVVRPWLDVGAVIGSGSHYPARPALVAAAEPVFDAGYPAVDELLEVPARRSAGVAGAVGAGVDIGRRYGVRFAVRRSWPLSGPRFGSRYLVGAGFAWEIGPVIRF